MRISLQSRSQESIFCRFPTFRDYRAQNTETILVELLLYAGRVGRHVTWSKHTRVVGGN